MRSRRILPGVLAAACLALAGCATTGAHTGSVKQLYTELDQASQAYRSAVLASDDGGSDAAGDEMQAALDRLHDAAARCDKTAGCDMQRFVSAYGRLLRGDGGHVADTGDDTASTPDDDTGQSVTRSVPQTRRTVTLLHGHKLSDLIAMNGPVKAALEDWLTWRRPQLMKAHQNYRYLRHLMWPRFDKTGLPEAVLFGIMAQESGGKVHAVSRSGAKGLMQFMPATGSRFGLKVVDGFDERFDPALSAQAAANYLDEQLKVFNDNLEMVLAAYNGGEGRMRRLAGNRTDESFYDPDIYFALPQETRHYVPTVLAAAWLFLHPDSYHLKFPRLDATPGRVKLARQASLSELTVCLGQSAGMQDGWFRTLRNLNPRINPQNELPAGTRVNLPQQLEAVYQRDCTDGPWPILAADLHSGSVPQPPPSGLPRHYIVRRGDTLSAIVRKLGCSSVHDVARLNHLKRPGYAIHEGQRLVLPRCY